MKAVMERPLLCGHYYRSDMAMTAQGGVAQSANGPLPQPPQSRWREGLDLKQQASGTAMLRTFGIQSIQVRLARHKTGSDTLLPGLRHPHTSQRPSNYCSTAHRARLSSTCCSGQNTVVLRDRQHGCRNGHPVHDSRKWPNGRHCGCPKLLHVHENQSSSVKGGRNSPMSLGSFHLKRT